MNAYVKPLFYGLAGGIHNGLYVWIESRLGGGLTVKLSHEQFYDGLDDGLGAGLVDTLNDAISKALRTKSENQS